jgi:hypothetical protein
MRKRKPDIRREDVKTEADKIAYSRMIYDRWQSIGPNEPPDAVLDWQRFPMETEDWHSGEYWIMRAKAEREKQRLLRGK